MRPPRLVELLVSLVAPPDYRDELIGDLREGFERRAQVGLTRARVWYVKQALRSVLPALRVRARQHPTSSTRRSPLMSALLQDLRFGLRSIRRSPLFAVVSIATLALAIGVNTSIFSIVSSIIFADLPMQDSETVSVVRAVNAPLGVDQGSLSVPDFLELAERSRSFESLTALTQDQWVLTGEDFPLRVRGYRATANLFDSWRLPPIRGRAFVEGEDQPGAAPVVMLSYPFWQSRYGGEDVLGRTLRLDGREHTIIGVTDPRLGFADFSRADVWVPLVLDRAGADRSARLLFVSGRLRADVGHAQATQEVDGIGRALAAEFPGANRGWDLWAAPVMESLIDDQGRTIMLMLILTVGFVILMACANVANMLLARSTARAREFSVRAALGAGRGRLVRQMLTEGMVISVLAGALGVGLAKALNVALVRISNGQEQALTMADLDGRTLAFTLVLALVAPLVFGILPALSASRRDPGASLNGARGADAQAGGRRARSALVGVQVSLALALMVVAGLLTRTVYNLQARPLGYDPGGLVAIQLDLPEDRFGTAESRDQFYAQALDATTATSAVRSGALLSALPGVGFGSLRSLDIEGRPVPEDRARPVVQILAGSPGWSEELGLALVSGRRLDASDGPDAPPVALVSQEVATRHWPDTDPVGARVRTSEEGPWIQIVGVVADVRGVSDEDRRASNLYRPYSQVRGAAMQMVLHVGASLDAVGPGLREAIWSVDRNVPIDRIQTVEQALYDASAGNYALLTLFLTFALFALVMAAVGIYGVTAYTVGQRRAELGLRIALGARVGQVERMVVGQGLRTVLTGLAFGLVAALFLGRMLRSVVVDVSPTDPLTFVGVPVVLLAVALVANYLPARAATRGDPISALRVD